MSDRIVHASLVTDERTDVVVRHNREGRWFRESRTGAEPTTSKRLKTVHEAVEISMELESNGGSIHLGRPGGRRFDYMVESARAKKVRGK